MEIVGLWPTALTDAFLQNLAERMPALRDLEEGAEGVEDNEFYGHLVAVTCYGALAALWVRQDIRNRAHRANIATQTEIIVLESTGSNDTLR